MKFKFLISQGDVAKRLRWRE